MVTQYLDLNGGSIVVRKREDFWEYIGRKSNRESFMKMGLRERETIYLTWRYGTHGYDGNKEAEATDNYLISDISEKDFAEMNESSREFLKMVLAGHKVCQRIRSEIGLTARSSKAKQLVEKVVEKTTQNYQDVEEQVVWAD